MDLKFSDMIDMQRELQARNAYHWEPMHPGQAHKQLLWGICEIGEVIDIIKKCGDDAIMNDPNTRHDFVEEFSDVLMYMADMMLCYNISADELAQVYKSKHARNMTRWHDDEVSSANE